jgi:hypothetical protein
MACLLFAGGLLCLTNFLKKRGAKNTRKKHTEKKQFKFIDYEHKTKKQN